VSIVFLISPAHCGGKRAQLLLKPGSQHPLALGLGTQRGVPLADVFTFASQLYFRGKLAYAVTFAQPPAGVGGVWIITPGVGLQSPSDRITGSDLVRMAGVRVAMDETRYREPLTDGVRRLTTSLGPRDGVVLLGSLASDKYWRILLNVLGDRLWFPPALFGLGSLSRGSLLLRSAQSGDELPYVTVSSLIDRAATQSGP
jgi:hypothetical protein